MSRLIPNKPAFLPQRSLGLLKEVDAEANRVRQEFDWSLGVFTAVFDEDLRELLLVQLGDYAATRYGARPWTLPGGAAKEHENASDAACRELAEECALIIDRGTMKPAGWFARPYFKGFRREQPGEIVVLFAAIGDPRDEGIRPAPPETFAAGFHPFSLTAFLAVPTFGEGEHPLQPLPRHWALWARVAQRALERPFDTEMLSHVYENSDAMRLPPWPSQQATTFENAGG